VKRTETIGTEGKRRGALRLALEAKPNHGLRIEAGEPACQSLRELSGVAIGNVKVFDDHRSRWQLDESPAQDSTADLSVGFYLQQHITFGFMSFGKARSLDRTGIDHGGLECMAGKVADEHLRSVNVTTEHRSESCWDTRSRDDI
jgi:hypothetical protein